MGDCPVHQKMSIISFFVLLTHVIERKEYILCNTAIDIGGRSHAPQSTRDIPVTSESKSTEEKSRTYLLYAKRALHLKATMSSRRPQGGSSRRGIDGKRPLGV